MNLRMKLTSVVTLTLLTATALPAAAFPLLGKKKPANQQELRKLTPAQSALIDKAIVREKVIVESLKKNTPLVETYIQNMRPDPVMSATPDSDTHFLARVDFGRVINDSPYASEKRGTGSTGHLGFFKDSLNYITHLSASLHLTYHDSGFVQMLLIDSNSFNRQTYQFSYVRAQFAGTVPVLLFDVQPTKKNNPGRFAGRIYVNRNTGDIVRFTGSFAGGQSDVSEFFHFDSYRTALPDGKWLPYEVYVEETDPKSPEHTLKFKALTYIWGYQLKVPTTDASAADIEIGDGADAQAAPLDMTPLAQQRMWVQQAEDNVIDRLFVAGLIDAPSDNDKILSDLANNILVYNKLPIDRPFKVRTLLTVPLETLAVGHTILISKGLLDTTSVYDPNGQNGPQVGNLYALLAFQVAHILLGHHIDTKFAFNDRLLFPSEAAFQKLPDGTFWMSGLLGKGPKLNNTDLNQVPAAPLDSLLHTDAWTDQVIQTTAPLDKLLSASDKIPFEVHAIFLQLGEYKAPVAPAPAPAAAPDATAPATTNAPATSTTGTSAPADATTPPTTTAPPPQR
jgi:hypothetical protein